MDKKRTAQSATALAPELGPKWLYLHGFASGPSSAKARAISDHYRAKGIFLDRLDLRHPSLEHLRLSAMMAHVRARIGGAADRAVLFGSSLGALTACRVAEQDARAVSLVLLAPAFKMVERWRSRIGEEKWRSWRESGWIAIDDFANKTVSRVDFGYAEEATRLDVGWPDVRVPTLIVHGTRDETASITLSREWAKGKRHVRLVEVDDGHDLAASFHRICREADAFLAPILGADA